MANGVTILLAILPFTTSQTEKHTPRSLSCLSLLKPKMGYEVVEERTLWLYHFTFYSHRYVSQYHYYFSKCSLGRFPFNPKFRKFKLVHQMERTISVWSDRNIRDQLWRSVGPKCPFPFDKIVVPSTALLYPACKNNNQTCGGLGRGGETGMYRSTWRVEFPKFQTRIFDEWKAPNTLRSWIVTQCCLLVQRNLTYLFLVQSLKFGTQHAVRTTSRWSGRAGA